MRAVLLVIGSAVLFGTTGTAQEYGPAAASSTAVGLTRIVAGGTLLGAVAWWAARRGGGTVPVVRRRHLVTIAVGGAAVLAYQPAFFAGTRLNGVAVGTAVALGSAPVMTGLLEWLVTRRLPGRAWFVGTSCAVVGVVLLSGLLEGGGHDISARGLAGSLGAALSYAVYAIAAKRLLDDGWTPTAAIGSVFAAAAAMGAPFLLFVDLGWLGSGPGIAMLGWLAIVTVVIAYVLFATGLQRLRASTVSTLTLVEPFTACILGIALLDERLSDAGWAGLLMLLAGVVMLARPPRPPRPPRRAATVSR